LRYVYQRIGFQYLTETLFDDAGKHFFAGNLDPRILISYYPELRGNLFGPQDMVDMFAGVTEHMPPEDSIDEISQYFLYITLPSFRSRLAVQLLSIRPNAYNLFRCCFSATGHPIQNQPFLLPVCPASIVGTNL
jgi:hypothetical protein